MNAADYDAIILIKNNRIDIYGMRQNIMKAVYGVFLINQEMILEMVPDILNILNQNNNEGEIKHDYNANITKH